MVEVVAAEAWEGVRASQYVKAKVKTVKTTGISLRTNSTRFRDVFVSIFTMLVFGFSLSYFCFLTQY